MRKRCGCSENEACSDCFENCSSKIVDIMMVVVLSLIIIELGIRIF